MSRRAALIDALLITLAAPATWPLALAAFLLRGGLLLVLLPIVVLPSPVSLGNVLGPALTTVVLSGVPVGLGIAVGLLAFAVVAWIAIGGLAAAAFEAEAARLVSRHEDETAPDRDGGASAAVTLVAVRILAARLVVHVPTVVTVVWGSARLVTVAYRELTSPAEVTSPIALRVLRGAPEAVAAILILWVVGEILGGVAARRIALGGATVPGALREAVVTVVRHPLVTLTGFCVPAAALALVVLPSAVAAAASWAAVRVAMGSSADAVGPTLAVLLFVALWTVGLLLIAVVVAWRAAVWSVAERDRWGRRNARGVTTPG